MNEELIQKLMISKKIMDRHNQIPRNTNASGFENTNYENDDKPISVESYQPVNGSYNIPEELLSESALPKKQSRNVETSKDAVLSSKLPDEIKRLMLEHPIQKPQQPEVKISNEIVEAASRLMGVSKPENKTQTKVNTTQTIQNTPDMKKLVKEAVKEILQESGLIVESTQKSNETFSFRVGQHIFEGKLTKIKKIKE